MIGRTIGPYEVVAAIGAGGMGEVYRARDTRLDRDVALKVVPAQFAQDAERLTRFAREAKVLAALNHPNIAAIYGVEDAGATRALVMELVEGRTLRELIAAAPLSLEDALPIARQIATALEAAHGAGVIHRDLKPANIKVRPDGAVKVLDFGLAKAFDSTASSPADVANSPTFTASGTEVGTILGTAAYMSPEQARGKLVDRRADLWAFGCVLFEMLTGKRAFAGETTTDILAAVVRAEPDWSSLPAGTPPSIRTLLRRCLAKDPAQRLADASSARLDIDDARSESSGAMSIAPAVPAPPASATARGRDRLSWIVAGAMTLVAIGAIVVAVRRPAPAASDAAEVRFRIDEPVNNAVVSPDGTAIAYGSLVNGAPQGILRNLATGTTTPLAAAGPDVYSYLWSPDGKSIGYLSAQKLKRVDLATGTVQTLADAPTPRGGAWGPDGTILFAPGGNGPLYRIAASGGTPEAATELGPQQASHRYPIFLPDGRHFLTWVLGPPGVRGESLGSLDTRQVTRLFDADGPASFAAPDQVLFVREGVLYAQRLDVAAAKLIGDAIAVASPVELSPTAAPRISASRNGVLAFRTDPEVRAQIQWVDRSGTEIETIGEPVAGLIAGSLSPDGRTLAVARMQHGATNIWLMDTARPGLTRFAIGNQPVWSSDGTRIAFQSTRDGFARLYWQRVGTSEPAELLFQSNEAQNIADWSADGRHVMFSSQSASNARDLWVLPADGAARTPTPFLQTAAEERNGAFSPDGKWYVHESDENGQLAIFVRPFPGPGRAWRVSTGEGFLPFWRADGREIYYRRATSLVAVSFDPSANTPVLGSPTPLFALQSPALGAALPLRARTDGQRFLLAVVKGPAAVAPLTVIVNWAGVR